MSRNLTIEEEIYINQFVQQLHSLETMEKWFDLYNYDEKRCVILNLINLVIQAHPTIEEIAYAADQLKMANTPATIKLLNPNKPYIKFGYELANLPKPELNGCFKLLLVTLSIADNRRKTEKCSNGCNHWWHLDLSDEAVLKKLRHK